MTILFLYVCQLVRLSDHPTDAYIRPSPSPYWLKDWVPNSLHQTICPSNHTSVCKYSPSTQSVWSVGFVHLFVDWLSDRVTDSPSVRKKSYRLNYFFSNRGYSSSIPLNSKNIHLYLFATFQDTDGYFKISESFWKRIVFILFIGLK